MVFQGKKICLKDLQKEVNLVSFLSKIRSYFGWNYKENYLFSQNGLRKLRVK